MNSIKNLYKIFVQSNGYEYFLKLYLTNASELNILSECWIKSQDNKRVYSIIPPLEELKLINHGQTVIVSPFKMINPFKNERKIASVKDIRNIQLQNNYTNKILHTISSQFSKN